MKKLVILLVLAALVFAGCDVLMPTGKAGKTYVAYDRDKSLYLYTTAIGGYENMTVYKAYLDLPGFPSSITFGQDYEIVADTYTGSACLYGLGSLSYSYYKKGGSIWRATHDIYYDTSTQNLARATTFTYTLKANPGKQGFLSAGADGADKYYSMYLAWDPANWGVTAKGAVPMSSKILSSSASKIVKEFTDGANTITLEINLGDGSPAASGADVVK